MKIVPLFKDAAAGWNTHRAPKMGAALAYYTVLSLAPLIMLVLSIVSLVFGSDAARHELTSQVSQLMGSSGAEAVKMILESSSSKTSGVVATVIGFLVLLFGASGVFGELQDSLNHIWATTPQKRSIWETIKDRFLSFAMVFVIGFLLMVSLVISAAIAAASKYMSNLMPGMETLWQLANFAVSFAVTTFLFAIIFRVLPDTEIEWRDVWFGAAMTALLFSIGRFLLGLYLGKSAVGSSYGAAGSFIVILVWVYYASQILFFGAELTRAYAAVHGTRRNRQGAPRDR